MDSSGSEQETVMDTCKHGNEQTGSINVREFCNKLNVLTCAQKGLCSIESVPVVTRLPHHNRKSVISLLCRSFFQHNPHPVHILHVYISISSPLKTSNLENATYLRHILSSCHSLTFITFTFSIDSEPYMGSSTWQYELNRTRLWDTLRKNWYNASCLSEKFSFTLTLFFPQKQWQTSQNTIIFYLFVVYFMMLPPTLTIQHQKNVANSNTVSWHLPEGTEKNYKKPVRVAGLWAKIWTYNLSNM
jgi:hypothetical protein